MAQAARDLDLHVNVLRKWEREQPADPQQPLPGHGRMKPEQPDIEKLRRMVARLKAERDILKRGRGLLRQGLDMRFSFVAKLESNSTASASDMSVLRGHFSQSRFSRHYRRVAQIAPRLANIERYGNSGGGEGLQSQRRSYLATRQLV